MLIDCTAEQRAHEARMAAGNDLFLSALKGETPGSKLIWTRTMNVPAETPTFSTERLRAIKQMAEKEAALQRKVNRDPCIKCGVRADIGCSHVS